MEDLRPDIERGRNEVVRVPLKINDFASVAGPVVPQNRIAHRATVVNAGGIEHCRVEGETPAGKKN